VNETKLKVTVQVLRYLLRSQGVHISGVATMTRALANREVPATGYHASQLAS
jgi:hypothetical protein